MLVFTLASCGKSPDPAGSPDAASASASPAGSPGNDACALLDDASALFGKPVTAESNTMPAFGTTQPLDGVGEEAMVVDGGMLGAQAGLRTATAAANLGAACGGSGPANLEHVEKLTRAVAGKL